MKYRTAIYDTLVKLPALKEELFQSLKIKRLASFEGRSPKDLPDAQMLAIDKFFDQLKIVLRALDLDAGYATGKADDLTTVFATMNPELKRLVEEELPKICATIAEPYCANIQASLTELFEWSSRTVPLGNSGDENDFLRYVENDYDRELAKTWASAVKQTIDQFKRIPKRYCDAEVLRFSEMFSSHPELKKCQRVLRRFGRSATSGMHGFEAAGVPKPPFGLDQDILYFFEAPLRWELDEQLAPEKRDGEIRESLRDMLSYAADGAARLYVEDSRDTPAELAAQEQEKDEYETVLNCVEKFLEDEATWWMIEQGPVEFGLFFERKRLLRKYRVHDRTVVDSGELGLLLEEIQMAFCLNRHASVAALSRAALEYVMKLHIIRVGAKIDLGEYKDAIFSSKQDSLKWNINIPLEEDESKLRKAVDAIHRFGNDVLHATHLKTQFDSKQMSLDRELLNQRMQDNCLVHIPAVVELLLPRVLGRA
jgi:hypothetical protein